MNCCHCGKELPIFDDKKRVELKEIMLEALKEYHSVPDWQRIYPHRIQK